MMISIFMWTGIILYLYLKFLWNATRTWKKVKVRGMWSY